MPLKRMLLRDFVIVHELDLTFEAGFTALTGETGAGKSILVDALQLALGARSDPNMIREGANRTEVAIEFDDLPKEIHTALQESGFDDDEVLLLRRVVDSQGKSRAFINGSSATVGQLRQLGENLVHIHGQHAWHGLTKADSIRQLFDEYAKIELTAVTSCWTTWQLAEKKWQEATQSQAQVQDKCTRLQWQIKELEKLAPKKGEWENINQQHSRLSSIQDLLETAQFGLDTLDNDEASILNSLSQSVHKLNAFSALEPVFSSLAQTMAEAQTQLDDVARDLRNYLARTEQEPDLLAQLDTRLSLWMGLAKQYRTQPEDLPSTWEQWTRELDELTQTVDLHLLEKNKTDAKKNYLEQAKKVNEQRLKYAPILSHAITATMQTLGMKGGVFQVTITPLNAPEKYGIDEVDFLFSGHAGNTPRPLIKIASGGELSRLSLAIAVCTSQNTGVATLIFDEIDAGVGGAVASTVGQLMNHLGKNNQVLSVTHLPQVAAYSNHHMLVKKEHIDLKTVGSVRVLQEGERVYEIARMLSGNITSDVTLAHAKELLQGAP